MIISNFICDYILIFIKNQVLYTNFVSKVDITIEIVFKKCYNYKSFKIFFKEIIMKFIHCSDLHLDSKMETNLTTSKARERRKEILLTFEKMLEYAKINDIKAIIIAGDMFDGDKVSASTKARVINDITKYKTIDFLYLSGNHDEMSVFSSLNELPSNLKIFKSSWTEFRYDNVSIVGTTLNSDNKQSIYDTLNLEENRVNIVVLHGQTSKYNSKQNVEVVNISKLKNKNVDYLALGHIHSYVKESLDKRGVYAYSGCLEGRGFDEIGDKGFVVLDVEENGVNSTFIPFASRKLIEIEFDITSYNSWFEVEDAILDKVSAISSKNLIKVTLIGSFNLNFEKQLDVLNSKLNSIFYFAKIKDNTTLKIDHKNYENDVSLKGEFIRQVLASSLTDEEKSKVILVGLKALSGEDVK